MEETGCEIIYGATTTLAVKGEIRADHDERERDQREIIWHLQFSFACMELSHSSNNTLQDIEYKTHVHQIMYVLQQSYVESVHCESITVTLTGT